MQATEERLIRDLQHGASDLRRTAQVMQLGVNPYKADSIVGCRIVYVLFLIINKSALKKD